MIDWAARAEKFFKTTYTPTDRTDEIWVSSVLSVPLSAVLEKSPEVSSVLSVGTPLLSENRASDDQTLSQCWRVIEGGRISEVTVAPPASRVEIRRRYPTAVVELRAGAAAAPSISDLALASSWALLIGERDLEVIASFADASGLAALRELAKNALFKAPATIIASLTDEEGLRAATVVVAEPDVDPGLGRAIAPILPAMQGRYGSLERRAAQARRVLALIAGDSANEAQPADPGDA